MNRNTLHFSGFNLVVFLGLLSLLLPGTANGAIKDDESRVLLERILEAHAKQSAALANYEFRAQWDMDRTGPGASTSKISGKIQRIRQGDRCYFIFTSIHDSRGSAMGDIHHELVTRGVFNDEYYATWAVDHATGQYISLRWFEMPTDGTFPENIGVPDYARTRIRPLETAMGFGGRSLQSLIDSYPSENILFTCREETAPEGGQRIRVTIERPNHGIPGPWAKVLLNPAKGYLTEESVVFGKDGAEFTRNVTLSKVRDGVWFPKEIVLKTTAATVKTRVRSGRFRLLDFKLGATYPDETFTIFALDTPRHLLESMGVSRFYLDGRTEVTTLEGDDHLGRKRKGSVSRVEK